MTDQGLLMGTLSIALLLRKSGHKWDNRIR